MRNQRGPFSIIVIVWAWAGILAVGSETLGGAPAVGREQADFFEAKIRPVLLGSCLGCHGAQKQASGLRLDGRSALLEGGENGPAAVPGDPDRSLLIQAVRRTHKEIKMPPKKELSSPEIDAMAAWVAMGLPWPDTVGLKGAGADEAPHWAYQPVRPQSLPKVRDGNWVRTPIDNFILELLDKIGLAPSTAADRRTLIRRATFDLTGLPPTPEEVRAFTSDLEPGAYERVVERLLASPRYGERWGRHWLDVARYSDTKDYLFKEERRYPYSYTYRDYVIRAFNEDKPYDTFVTEQIAADQLGPDRDPAALAAMGFLTVGRRFRNNQNDIIDDRIDVVSRGLLGLTVACARCHDHKFDAIPAEDYYSLYGVFASSFEPSELPRLPTSATAAQIRDFQEKLAILEEARASHCAAKLAEIRGDFRARAGLFLRTAAGLNFDPNHPELEERARANGLGVERLHGLIERWRAALTASRKVLDPVYAPWLSLEEIPAAEFASKAPGVLKALAAADPKSVNSVIARALAEDPPATLAEAAACYGRLLDVVEMRWHEAEKAGSQALADPAWEQLRQMLYAKNRLATVSASDLGGLLNRAEEEEIKEFDNKLVALAATHEGAPPRAMVLKDRPSPVEPHVFLRGNPDREGKAVPRRFLAVLAGQGRTLFKTGSGRLELARAIIDRNNPLTARVMVNRIWLHHFGKGLVATPSDFGTRGEPPTHPALLDWLADDFMRQGWSVKSLHRRIMLSNTYCQQSLSRPEAVAKDPENRLYGRFDRRRLEFEEVRDAILAVSGTLDLTTGGLPVAITEPPFPGRRTVYGFIDRLNLDGAYRTFDFATPDASSPKRFVTTVPQQALFLMNSPLILGEVRRLAASPLAASGTPEDRIEALYVRLFGRAPTAHEKALGLAFLQGVRAPVLPLTGFESSGLGGLSSWEQYAQVLLLSNDFMFID